MLGGEDSGENLGEELKLSIPMCLLLHSQKHWTQFIDASKKLLFGFIPQALTRPVQQSELLLLLTTD